jgi:hypothetical protein
MSHTEGGNTMESILVRVFGQLILTWRGTPAYADLIKQLAKIVRDAIPDHALEPQIGQFLVDLGTALDKPA